MSAWLHIKELVPELRAARAAGDHALGDCIAHRIRLWCIHFADMCGVRVKWVVPEGRPSCVGRLPGYTGPGNDEPCVRLEERS